MAGRAQNRMTYDVNVPDGAIQMHDAVVRLATGTLERARLRQLEADLANELTRGTPRPTSPVRNSGPGIEKQGCVGMGLSICQSIIDAHGGRLWIDANEPRGAVFRFTLPGAEGDS